MDHERLYAHRHAGMDASKKAAVWREIASFVAKRAGNPDAVLDPACGAGEFIGAIEAGDKWAVDMMAPVDITDDVHFIRGDFMEIEVPEGRFDLIFVSNFLEHLPNPESVQSFLAKARRCLAPGGRLVVMGPNFRYCWRRYFDYADHRLALTHVTVVEHLHMAGFTPTSVVPRFLPYSFNGRLPTGAMLVRLYLRLPFAWPVFGRQFLITATAAES